MKILLVSAHPVEDSYNAALRQAAMAALQHAGHEVDHLDLYAEGFDPVLGRAERLGYHEVPANRAPRRWSLSSQSGVTACQPF